MWERATAQLTFCHLEMVAILPKLDGPQASHDILVHNFEKFSQSFQKKMREKRRDE